MEPLCKICGVTRCVDVVILEVLVVVVPVVPVVLLAQERQSNKFDVSILLHHQTWRHIWRRPD